jgi:cytoskeletal protein CcmA (bactofilin family)
VEGDIFTDKLAVEPGSSFTGACNMGAKVKEMKKEGQSDAVINAAQ